MNLNPKPINNMGSPIPTDKIPQVSLLGVRIHSLSIQELIDYIGLSIQNNEKRIIAYVNAYAMNLSYELPWFREFLNQTDITFCDGFGVKWGAKILSQNILHRYTPPDWVPLVCEICVKNNSSMFFLGASEGIAEAAASTLRIKYPSLRIVGVNNGYFDKMPNSPDNQKVINKINHLQPDILILGMGMPLQEKWLLENWDQINAKVAITAGALFDYISNNVYRVPQWMTDNGFEWLGRLIIEPRRLWKRYLIGNPLFISRILKQKFGFVRFK